jgi:hypothetical protein
MPSMSQHPVRQEPAAGERYTEQQLVEILRRASERQDGPAGDADGRFSLVEIQQIAAEVGIPPAHIAAAAAELDSRFPAARAGVLGAPTAFQYERWVDGELTRDGIGELFDIARREVGLQGTVSEAFDTIEWRAAGQMGLTIVSIVRRSGRTRITVSISRSNAAAVVASSSAVAGGIAAMAIGSSLMVTGAAPLAVVAVAAVSLTWGGVGSWLAMRGIWRRIARSWAPRAQALGAELVVVAQQAIDAARKHSE